MCGREAVWVWVWGWITRLFRDILWRRWRLCWRLWAPACSWSCRTLCYSRTCRSKTAVHACVCVWERVCTRKCMCDLSTCMFLIVPNTVLLAYMQIENSCACVCVCVWDSVFECECECMCTHVCAWVRARARVRVCILVPNLLALLYCHHGARRGPSLLWNELYTFSFTLGYKTRTIEQKEDPFLCETSYETRPIFSCSETPSATRGPSFSWNEQYVLFHSWL